MIKVYADGSRQRNGEALGWGVHLEIPGHPPRQFSGQETQGTAARMEVLAVLRGLEATEPSTKVEVYSDSRYVVDSYGKGWVFSWARRGWLKSTGEPAKHPDLWQRIIDLCNERDVSFHWVKGHNGHPQNEACDRLAQLAANGHVVPLKQAAPKPTKTPVQQGTRVFWDTKTPEPGSYLVTVERKKIRSVHEAVWDGSRWSRRDVIAWAHLPDPSDLPTD